MVKIGDLYKLRPNQKEACNKHPEKFAEWGVAVLAGSTGYLNKIEHEYLCDSCRRQREAVKSILKSSLHHVFTTKNRPPNKA